MAKIVSLIPHALNVKKEDGSITTIEPSGVVARVAMTQKVIGEINGIPLVKTVFGDVTGVPEPENDVVFVVSTMVATRLSDRQDLVSPDTGPTAVRENGQIVAITRFQQHFGYNMIVTITN